MHGKRDLTEEVGPEESSYIRTDPLEKRPDPRRLESPGKERKTLECANKKHLTTITRQNISSFLHKMPNSHKPKNSKDNSEASKKTQLRGQAYIGLGKDTKRDVFYNLSSNGAIIEIHYRVLYQP